MRRATFASVAGLAVVGVTLTGCTAPDESAPAPAAAPFEIEETTIAEIHAHLAEGDLTCVDLVQGYLDRIDAYEHNGPRLHSIITVNDAALQRAAELDEAYADDAEAAGSLHCVPVLLKDNYNTFDLPTSSGNTALADMVSARDAFAVARMREEGAIFLAKTNLQEFARGGDSISSLGGQVLNPYDLTRTAGGSSGGTGAAIAANLGAVGTGSDTGQSIRSPASANSLVGVRPTRGLVSRNGVAPNSYTQDEIGPITRTVEDAARVLEVMAGYDPNDPITVLGVDHVPASYVDGLDAHALEGARIGLLTDLLGTDEALHGEVNDVVDRAVEEMEELGAEVVRFSIPNWAELSSNVATAVYEAEPAMAAYLAEVGSGAPYSTLAEIAATESAVPDVQKSLQEELAVGEGMASPEYFEKTANRESLKLAVLQAMAEHDIDVILYPLQKRLVSKIGEPQAERNGVLSNGTGMPAITFPGGFSSATADAPLGVPIGVELLGPDFSEQMLLSYAYAFEQATSIRKAPESTPALQD
ncbi:amidase family protein [Microbacterium sp. zg.Y625]|uniref:amidase n=1 Tax=Microbacterium jiangjiandongii TaxID=3049071 RepID=UPI00214B6875|nr:MULTISPECIES: amidase family protein [unclassified Microbacterium]MCR2792809.1 amidase family protein [Microbacterium sp. zg.Y625]WIM26784.1 amidase family protein [Microbacterium sp. zg-Y625]